MSDSTTERAGTFVIQMHPEPPYGADGGVTLGRLRFEKHFSGPLTATSEVHMLAVRTATEGSAGYVASERIVGSVDGRAGSFVVMHTGVMDRGQSSLSIVIVPDSGTGALAGIRGTMDIAVIEGEHRYTLRYALPAAG